MIAALGYVSGIRGVQEMKNGEKERANSSDWQRLREQNTTTKASDSTRDLFGKAPEAPRGT